MNCTFLDNANSSLDRIGVCLLWSIFWTECTSSADHGSADMSPKQWIIEKIGQKGMTFDHGFDYFLPLFSSLLQKEERKKGEWIAKIAKVMPFCSINSKFNGKLFNRSATSFWLWLMAIKWGILRHRNQTNR